VYLILADGKVGPKISLRGNKVRFAAAVDYTLLVEVFYN
jgi:hypothetical protein